jgi:D-alanyl-D-alanine carboxypeptidase/D-alanyl-D-alanine-endopeptidase (penicillin-binding protein 4)
MKCVFVAAVLALILSASGCGNRNNQSFTVNDSNVASPELPAQIQSIMGKQLYNGSTFALRVEDARTGQLLFDLNSTQLSLIGSVRKLFSVGLALDELSSAFRFRTPVHRQGNIANGLLSGDLILVASGDLTMGGRRGPNDTIELTDIDHNEANSVGNAISPSQDPLAGFRDLARQVAASGIREVGGEVIIDDRLFQPYEFRGQFMANAVFVNDNVIDINMRPTQVGDPAEVLVSPLSQAFTVLSTVQTVAGGGLPTAELSEATCFGLVGCQGTVAGVLPINGAPLFTNAYPYLQTFRITNPSGYARTVFIEALRDAGVTVTAATVGPNASNLLPAQGSYPAETRVAELVSPPFSQYANYILKVSYNLGAETALMLLGLTDNATTQAAALVVEREILASEFAIAPNEYQFVDGSGGGESTATAAAITRLLRAMIDRPVFADYREALPVIGGPGLLTEIEQISNDPTLSGSIGNISAKTGTFATGTEEGIQIRARALAGYITARSGREIVFALTVNEVGPFADFVDAIEVFNDLDVIAAILWREL